MFFVWRFGTSDPWALHARVYSFDVLVTFALTGLYVVGAVGWRAGSSRSRWRDLRRIGLPAASHRETTWRAKGGGRPRRLYALAQARACHDRDAVIWHERNQPRTSSGVTASNARVMAADNSGCVRAAKPRKRVLILLHIFSIGL